MGRVGDSRPLPWRGGARSVFVVFFWGGVCSGGRVDPTAHAESWRPNSSLFVSPLFPFLVFLFASLARARWPRPASGGGLPTRCGRRPCSCAARYRAAPPTRYCRVSRRAGPAAPSPRVSRVPPTPRGRHRRHPTLSSSPPECMHTCSSPVRTSLRVRTRPGSEGAPERAPPLPPPASSPSSLLEYPPRAAAAAAAAATALRQRPDTHVRSGGVSEGRRRGGLPRASTDLHSPRGAATSAPSPPPTVRNWSGGLPARGRARYPARSAGQRSRARRHHHDAS